MGFVKILKDFKARGYIIEKFRGHTGLGYYAIPVSAYKAGYRDYVFVSRSVKGCGDAIKSGIFNDRVKVISKREWQDLATDYKFEDKDGLRYILTPGCVLLPVLVSETERI